MMFCLYQTIWPIEISLFIAEPVATEVAVNTSL